MDFNMENPTWWEALLQPFIALISCVGLLLIIIVILDWKYGNKTEKPQQPTTKDKKESAP